MSDIKLFRTVNETVVELEGASVALEKSLQALIEKHLDVFLGIRFLATEYSTGKTHGGRLDTLGIDENGCPCIIEYKRSSNENVINQGLFYLDWLMDHQAEFELLVLKAFGKELADEIEWSSPRLICIAGDFNKYDEHAVQQINRNIELVRYRRFGDELLLIEMVHAVTTAAPKPPNKKPQPTVNTGNQAKSVEDYIERSSPELIAVYEALTEFLLSLGDDVQMKILKWYIAFKRIKNFACVEFQYKQDKLLVFLKVDPTTLEPEADFIRDVSEIGHYGTGDLELTLRTLEDVEKAKPLIERSYQAS